MGAVAAISTAPALVLQDLTVRYGHCVALRKVCAAIASGSLTAIVGPNGAGKSTLLNAMTGLTAIAERASVEGTVCFGPGIRDRVAYLPQRSALDRTFPITVLDLVALGAWRRVGATRRINRQEIAAAHECLASVGLGAQARQPVGKLSAGQLQRALFARAMLEDACLILLDEPFNAVDARTTEDLLAVMRNWHAEGRTVVAVLHDLDQVRAHFKDALLLSRRCIAWGSIPEVLTPENLARARRLAQERGEGGAISETLEP